MKKIVYTMSAVKTTIFCKFSELVLICIQSLLFMPHLCLTITSDCTAVCSVSSGQLIKQAVASRSSVGLACKEFIDQKQLGNIWTSALVCLDTSQWRRQDLVHETKRN